MTTGTLPEVRPIEVVTPIKPSEAMRLGRLRYPRPFRGKEYGPEPGQACARGAIYAGYGGGPDDTASAFLALSQAVGTGDIGGPCPDADRTWLCDWTGETPETTLSMTYAVVHFNDLHHWDDERIADWLEGRGL